MVLTRKWIGWRRMEEFRETELKEWIMSFYNKLKWLPDSVDWSTDDKNVGITY